MSVLSNKKIIIMGEENAQVRKLKEALLPLGVKFFNIDCADVTLEFVAKLKYDLILLNDQHDGDLCMDTLNLLIDQEVSQVIPIFVLVKNTNEDIKEVLSFGAADYIIPDEGTESIVKKMRTIFGEGDVSGVSVIDITPTEAKVTATGIRVYIVEDDPLLRNLLSIRMEKSSFPYEFSTDGKLAVEAMKQFKPNVVILDLMLPGKSGFEVLQEIKADFTLKNIPVIVFSNRDGQDDRKKASELGAAGFYVKAMTDLSELVETIESLAK